MLTRHSDDVACDDVALSDTWRDDMYDMSYKSF